jgi:hypothetical protein
MSGYPPAPGVANTGKLAAVDHRDHGLPVDAKDRRHLVDGQCDGTAVEDGCGGFTVFGVGWDDAEFRHW